MEMTGPWLIAAHSFPLAALTWFNTIVIIVSIGVNIFNHPNGPSAIFFLAKIFWVIFG